MSFKTYNSWTEALTDITQSLTHGSVTSVEVQHDSWCVVLRTGRGDDCNCHPRVAVDEVFDLQEDP